MRRYLRVMAMAAIAVGAAQIGTPASAQLLMSPEYAKVSIEDRFGVEVLKVEEAEIEGRPAFLLHVMNPAGNFNEAFQVNTLALDRVTGALILQYRQGVSGYRGAGPAGRETGSALPGSLR